MASTRIRGIVVEESPMGDKDKRLVILTREMGKIPVLGKGAKTPSARSFAASHRFCYSEFILDKGKTFYYIKESEVLESFHELSQDIECFGFASVMLEMAREASVDGQDNSELVDLLLRGFLRLKKDTSAGEMICTIFLMRVMCDSGFTPELSGCTQCGQPYDGIGHWTFSETKGGLCCPQHSMKSSYTIHGGTVAALRYIASARSSRLYLFSITEEIQTELFRLVTQYMKEHSGIYLKSLEFVHQLGY